jgi:hypothetical protein
MSETGLPKHVLDRAERRWASRLAREAVSWRSEKPKLGDRTAVVDRSGRLVPVAYKQSVPVRRTA